MLKITAAKNGYSANDSKLKIPRRLLFWNINKAT
jgi:hypothetical protein